MRITDRYTQNAFKEKVTRWLLGAASFTLHFSIFTSLASCSDDDAAPAAPQQEVTVVNVDVILPQVQWSEWQPAMGEALNYLEMAQEACRKRVRLNLRYHDEDSEDLSALAYALTHPGHGDVRYVQPDTCHAIIGPYHSDHARTILDQAQRLRLPVVMPACTSAELQRTEARKTNSFFFTESDITQCEVLLSVMQSVGHQRVCMLYSDDTYGKSFRDWFGFVATQLGLDVVNGGIRAYHEDDNLQDYFDRMASSAGEDATGLLVALSSSEAYSGVMEQREQYIDSQQSKEQPKICPVVYVADTGLSSGLLKYHLFGTYPIGSADNGFMQNYYARHGNAPYGAAQVYDALTTIALGRFAQLCAADPDVLYIDGKRVEYEIAPFQPNLSDWMRAVLAADDPAPITLWIGYGLASAFRLIEGGTLPSLSGATGKMEFDPDTHTTILHTNYLLWESDGTGAIVPFATVSTGGSVNSLTTEAIWHWQATVHSLDPDAGTNVNHHLPDLGQRWAVIVSPSTTWDNYRHQADAFAMYQLLRRHGYNDDHIVLIVEDNLADSPQNPMPGEIYLDRSADQSLNDPLLARDVRQNAVVDYHFSDLSSPDDLADILLGRSSDRLPHVIHPTEADNVFLFWSGHGGDSAGPLWGNEDSHEPFGVNRIRRIVEQMQQPRQYRRMMFVLEACYSGLWGEALTGQPDLLVLTAANAYETSKADIYDSDIRTYLSNGFSRAFLHSINANPSIPISDLYYNLARTTAGSHVTLYNADHYGSAYSNNMAEFFEPSNE
ncbi:MAG: ABC transporter substrate-binding protein [Prevotella sp.]|nr:ABC transporter substrate-binding protein [Prevotella sp.]